MDRKCEACGGTGQEGRTFLLKPCAACLGYGISARRCSQHWGFAPIANFVGKRGLVKRCHDCTKKYANWSSKPLAEREAATSPRTGLPSDGPIRVSFALESGNRKTGPIPVSMTSSPSCPPSCPLFNRGCYAEQHMVGMHWRRLSSGKSGVEWAEFVELVERLPTGQIWRHNEAGDLPGVGEEIDFKALGALISANVGKRGFTYTHKSHENAQNRMVILFALSQGFTINISTDSLEAADVAFSAGLPTTTVLPHDAPAKGNRTPGGVPIVVCPAELDDDVSCARCKLCAVGARKSIVGFRAHGDRKKQITSRKRQLPLLPVGASS